MSWNVVLISRGIWDDPDFADEPYTEREAFMWLIGAAAWKETRVRGTGKAPVALKRGEFSFSLRFLAERFSWSKDRARRFINMLRVRDIIRDTSRDGAQVYSLKNYNKFQADPSKKRDSERHAEDTESAPSVRETRDKEESSNPVIQKKESISLASRRSGLNGHAIDFEEFYSSYAVKKARRAAEKAYLAALKRGATPEQLLAGAQRYAAEVSGKDANFVKHPARWLDGDCWRDENSQAPPGLHAGLDPTIAKIREIEAREGKTK